MCEPARRDVMRLVLGQMAPTFATRDLYGRAVALHDYRGAYVLLSFYRFAVCPVGKVRMHYLAQRAEAYRRTGVYFMAHVEPPHENSHFSLARDTPPVPFIPYLRGELYHTYVVVSSPVCLLAGPAA